MAKQWFLLVWIFIPLTAIAQWSDNFSDGNFSQAPPWKGDVSKFSVNTSGQLQLMAPAETGSASLYTASDIALKATWMFWVKMDFNPSSGNYAKVYLISNQPAPGAATDGYFLRIGGTNDDLCLFRQQGEKEFLIAEGPDKMFNTSVVTARIKVTRDDKGNWALFCDTTGGTNFQYVAGCCDFTVKSSAFFGVQCVYTSTRSSKFYFDDFRVSGKSFSDGVMPRIESFRILDNKRLILTFSDIVDKGTATYYPDFSMENNSLSTINYKESGKDIELTFARSFACDHENKLDIKKIANASGLKMKDTSLNFTYCSALLFDVVFNEIMADPLPSAGLPEGEYIELYNRSKQLFDLHGWELWIGSAKYILPSLSLAPDSFLIITSKLNVSKFAGFGKVVGLFNSSQLLNNTGQYLQLKNGEGNLVDYIHYEDTWYDDNFKAKGGWSLEQIDPSNPCGGKINWKASQAKTGGTPGHRNSVLASNPDRAIPEILRIYVQDDSTINLYFTEPVDSVVATNVESYNISPDIGKPGEVRVSDNSFTSVRLLLLSKLKSDRSYSLHLSNNITDCAGNKLPGDVTLIFQLPSYPESNSIVINEVLFNPQSGGSEYVELYNRSGKTLDAKRLLIGVETKGKISGFCRVSEAGFLIPPASYVLLTNNPEKVKPYFKVTDDKNFITLASMPSLDDKSSTLILQNDTFGNIDIFAYSEKMHLATLKSVEGVSLERVNPDKPSNFPGNWHSAAETVGYGTPGYKNSQYLTDSVGSASIVLNDNVFSPDGDGYNDILQVSYQFDKPGLRAQVIVFDASGRMMKHLLNNELLGTSGSFTWDGSNDAGHICPVGIYLLFIRAVSDDGMVNEYKKTCVLAIKR